MKKSIRNQNHLILGAAESRTEKRVRQRIGDQTMKRHTSLVSDARPSNPLRIAVIGAAGNVGRRVVAEALARGHEVTAVVRHEARFHELPPTVRARTGDAGDVDSVAAISAGQDVVIASTRPPAGTESEASKITRRLIAGVRKSRVRLIVVGGAATLTVPGAAGLTVLEDPRYLPPQARAVARASADQYEVYLSESEVDWAYLSPPADLVPGIRTGSYRLGTDELLVDADGNSTISMEDLAVAVLDEVEYPANHQTRFTVAY